MDDEIVIQQALYFSEDLLNSLKFAFSPLCHSEALTSSPVRVPVGLLWCSDLPRASMSEPSHLLALRRLSAESTVTEKADRQREVVTAFGDVLMFFCTQ